MVARNLFKGFTFFFFLHLKDFYKIEACLLCLLQALVELEK